MSSRKLELRNEADGQRSVRAKSSVYILKMANSEGTFSDLKTFSNNFIVWSKLSYRTSALILHNNKEKIIFDERTVLNMFFDKQKEELVVMWCDLIMCCDRVSLHWIEERKIILFLAKREIWIWNECGFYIDLHIANRLCMCVCLDISCRWVMNFFVVHVKQILLHDFLGNVSCFSFCCSESLQLKV